MKIHYLLLVVFFVKITFINSYSLTNWEKLVNASNQIKSRYLSFNEKFFETLIISTNISKECEKSISQTLKSLNNLDDWSYQMYNSWGNFPPKGIIEGTVIDFGDYDQCFSITPNEVIGESQYCLIDISFPIPKPIKKHHNFYHKVDVLPDYLNKSENNVFVKLSKDASFFYWFFIRLGICVPNKCSLNDIKVLAEKSIDSFGLILKDVNCEAKNHIKLDLIQIIAILLIITFLFASIFATTLVQILNLKKNSDYRQILEAFSMKSNIKMLLKTKVNDQQISCIHGIKVITILWVMLGHTIEWTYLGIYRQIFDMKVKLGAPENQILLQGYYSVETFFFIGGLLGMYISMKYLEEGTNQFSKIGYIISRFIRLTPQLAIFMLLTTLIPLMGSGPQWSPYISSIVDKCYSNWWQNLLYLQTFFDTQNMCGLHTWYIATDMQFYWLSLIVILALIRNKRLGLIVNSLIIFGFVSLTAILVFVNDFPPAYVFTSRGDFMFDDMAWNPFFKYFFWKPWPHGSVYFIGLAFGYIVYNTRPKKISYLKKIIIYTLLTFGYIIAFYDNQFWIYGEPYNQWVSTFLYPLKRVIWALNTATIIWMCITGNGGYVNKFLSWKGFIPLSRVTYCVYLTHAWIVWIYWGSKRDLVDMKSFSILFQISGVLIISIFLGALFSLIFESPFFKLQNYIKKHYFNRNPNHSISPLNITAVKTSQL